MSCAWQFTPVVRATAREAEIRRITLSGQPRQKFKKNTTGARRACGRKQ
jgi:hypothetical protein